MRKMTCEVCLSTLSNHFRPKSSSASRLALRPSKYCCWNQHLKRASRSWAARRGWSSARFSLFSTFASASWCWCSQTAAVRPSTLAALRTDASEFLIITGVPTKRNSARNPAGPLDLPPSSTPAHPEALSTYSSP